MPIFKGQGHQHFLRGKGHRLEEIFVFLMGHQGNDQRQWRQSSFDPVKNMSKAGVLLIIQSTCLKVQSHFWFSLRYYTSQSLLPSWVCLEYM